MADLLIALVYLITAHLQHPLAIPPELSLRDGVKTAAKSWLEPERYVRTPTAGLLQGRRWGSGYSQDCGGSA
jgi:hypothetical protein